MQSCEMLELVLTVFGISQLMCSAFFNTAFLLSICSTLLLSFMLMMLPCIFDRKEHEKCEFDVHEVYAVDVIISTGEGKVTIAKMFLLFNMYLEFALCFHATLKEIHFVFKIFTKH
jgi:hypothetical protein